MIRIALLPGDGIGPEVVAAAVEVLGAVCRSHGFDVATHTLDLGAERYLRTGETLPEGDFVRLRDDFDAILFGALGDPRVPTNVHARDILLGLRQRLDLYVNLRPVALWHESLCPLKGRVAGSIDMAVVRENTESLYVGIGGTFKPGTPDEIAQNVMISTRKGAERLLRFAFGLARQRRGHLVLCDKANAIEAAHGLWRRVLRELAPEFPDVRATTLYADVACMRMVTHPHEFDVVVGDNFVGDILSDLAAALVGGLGLAPSASTHPGRVGLYEPVHGSAPDIAGTGRANPLAAILSLAMLLRDCGQPGAATDIETACADTVRAGLTTPDLGGTLGTRDVTASVLARIRPRPATPEAAAVPAPNG
ncbi:MAG: isocitrate/isopropylmalate dehydrogenase family protein [Myxococcales bacterium]|nr:isocitrate/isopropylmalate dehydrogenase family protein [Myxococcales bacterium]